MQRLLTIKYIVLLILMCLTSNAVAQEFKYVAEVFNKDHGLPDEYIKDIDFDSEGNLWILTRRGIVKFDGSTFEPLEIDATIPINNLKIDKNDNLWLKLAIPQKTFDKWDGIQVFDINTSRMLSLKEYCGFESFDNSKFYHMWKDVQGNIVFNYVNEKAFFYDGKKLKTILDDGSFSFINENNQRPNTISYTNFHRDTIFYKDLKSGAIELYTEKDVSFYIWKDGEIAHKSYFDFDWKLVLQAKKPYQFDLISVDNDTVVSDYSGRWIYRYHEDDLYFVTHSSLEVYDASSKQVINLSTSIFPSSSNPELLTMEAHNGAIWVASTDGLVKIEKKKKIFQSILSGNYLSTREMLAISEDSILIGTENGIYLVDNRSNEILEVFERGQQFYGLSDLGGGRYLAGTIGHYSKILDLNDKTVRKFPYQVALFLPPGMRDVQYNSFVDKNNDIWLTSSKGISRYDADQDDLVYYHQDDLTDITFFDIVQGIDENHLFHLSNNGLFEYNIESNDLKRFEALNGKIISCISKDMEDESVYWVGTRFDGLLRWEYDGEIVDRISVEDGLSNNSIHSIFEDKHNRLWLSTDYGISIYNKQTNEISVITDENGIHESEMNRHSYCVVNDSLLLYGGLNGVIKFNPYDVRFEFSSNELVPKSLSYVNNISDSKHVIPIPAYVSNLTIRRYQSDVKLNFDIPQSSYSNTLRYIASSENDGWRYTQSNFINLSELKEGNTNLFVSKKVGINEWSSPKTFEIYKRPPFYRNYWFYGLAISLISFGIFLYVNNRRVRALKLNRRIKQEVDIKTKELFYKNKSLTESKRLNDQLFGIIGHDLRSPLISLNNISKSIQYLTERAEYEDVKKLTKTVESNSRKSLAIIDRLIDWTKTQKGSMLEFQEVEISEVVRKCIYEHEDAARQKGVKLISEGKNWVKCVSNEASLLIVLGNVLSNAIKFSHENGSVSIKYYTDDTNVIIEVIDHGIGMDEEQVNKLNRSQSLSPQKGPGGEIGLGMGILLSSEILIKINGHLTFESVLHQGTTSTISLSQ